jgi:hypothetical protein
MGPSIVPPVTMDGFLKKQVAALLPAVQAPAQRCGVRTGPWVPVSVDI